MPGQELLWSIVPDGDNAVDPEDFVGHVLPAGRCVLTQAHEKNITECDVTQGYTPWIVQDCEDEGNETFAIDLRDRQGHMVAHVTNPDFALTEFFDFERAGNTFYKKTSADRHCK